MWTMLLITDQSFSSKVSLKILCGDLKMLLRMRRDVFVSPGPCKQTKLNNFGFTIFPVNTKFECIVNVAYIYLCVYRIVLFLLQDGGGSIAV